MRRKKIEDDMRREYEQKLRREQQDETRRNDPEGRPTEAMTGHPLDRGPVPLWHPKMQLQAGGQLPNNVPRLVVEALQRLGPYFYGPYPKGLDWGTKDVKHFSGAHSGSFDKVYIGDKGAYGERAKHEGNPEGWKCVSRARHLD